MAEVGRFAFWTAQCLTHYFIMSNITMTRTWQNDTSLDGRHSASESMTKRESKREENAVNHNIQSIQCLKNDKMNMI